MDLTHEQIQAFCTGILVSDIKEYINNNLEKYELFLKNRENTK